jgi:pyruvate dehydrogenase E1 component
MALGARLSYLAELERKVLWLSTWMIHNANHRRDNLDGLKVGGHQASSASLSTTMTTLYFAVLRPENGVAVKPHAIPILHVIHHLFGRQTREKLKIFCSFKRDLPSNSLLNRVWFESGSSRGLGLAGPVPM